MPGPDIPVPHWTAYVAQDLRQAIDEMERHAKEVQEPIEDTHNWAIGDLIADERSQPPDDDDVHRKKRSPTHVSRDLPLRAVLNSASACSSTSLRIYERRC